MMLTDEESLKIGDKLFFSAFSWLSIGLSRAQGAANTTLQTLDEQWESRGAIPLPHLPTSRSEDSIA